MANKKFTPEEIAILKANPYVMEVTEDMQIWLTNLSLGDE